MARRINGSLTTNEWKVMTIVWELKRCAARDVCRLTEERDGWAPSTTKTYLARLVEKGRLRATRVGNSFLYRPRVSVSFPTCARRLITCWRGCLRRWAGRCLPT